MTTSMNKPELRKHQTGMEYTFSPPNMAGFHIFVSWDKVRGFTVTSKVPDVESIERSFKAESEAWAYAQAIWDEWVVPTETAQ